MTDAERVSAYLSTLTIATVRSNVKQAATLLAAARDIMVEFERIFDEDERKNIASIIDELVTMSCGYDGSDI